ncbi:MAG: chloride channel protein [Anaerolineales bacterium]|jgi:CIC family chloride channel protein
MDLNKLFGKFQLTPTMLQGAAALLIGLCSGGLVLLFRRVIDLIYEFFHTGVMGLFPSQLAWLVIFIPMIGGLIVGLMRQYVLAGERHHGVAGVMEAVALAGGRLRYQRTPLKALAAAISIGAGASVGPEDPSVQIGASFGSMIGQLTKISADRLRVLVATGAAAGIAAAFNAPIAGVFFAIEIVLGELTTRAFGMIVLGSVVSAVVTQAVAGSTPAFAIPAYEFRGPLDLPLYFILGLLAVPVALAYIKSLYFFHDWFQRVPWPRWLSPVLVGLLLGVVGLRYPGLLGDSYDAIGNILFGRDIVPLTLLLLLILKMVLTAMSLGSGFVGGVFAPSLFLGAALGGSYGYLMQNILPSLNVNPSAFALVGMAAVLASTVRAPITAFMLLFEMTNDYRIFLPLMFAVVISVIVSERFQPYSVYTLSLARKGVRLRQGRDVDLLESLMVAEVMDDIPTAIPMTTQVGEASKILTRERAHGLPVIDPAGELLGVLTIQDIETALEGDLKNASRKVIDFCTQDPEVTYPDETVQQAMRKMAPRDIGRLPVVDRNNPHELLGWLRRSTVLRAYDLALVRRATDRHVGDQLKLGAISGAEVVEFLVSPDSEIVGKRMSEISWPASCLVASVRRGWNLIIPHGDTRLKRGDRLAVVVEKEDEGIVRRLVEGETAETE